jgi:hypothetical protein
MVKVVAEDDSLDQDANLVMFMFCLSEVNTMVGSSVRDSVLAMPEIELSLLVDSIVVTAMLDMGSNKMPIQCQFCEEHDFEVQKAQGYI